jgi:non-ribosomal peptide synthetase component F
MSGERDVVLGTYGTTRRLAATRDTFGFFANPLALRLRLSGDLSFREWLARVRTVVVESSAHAQTPYDALSEELREGGTIPPEFQAVVLAGEEMPLRLSPAVELTRLSVAFGTMPWGFSLASRRVGERERLGALFDARLHHPRAVRVFLKRYRRLLGRVCAEPDQPLSELIPRRWHHFGPLLRRSVVGRR